MGHLEEVLKINGHQESMHQNPRSPKPTQALGHAAACVLSSSSLCSFCRASSPRLFSTLSATSASHSFGPCRSRLSSSLISVSIHCSKSQSGGRVCKKNNCYKSNKSCKTSYDTKYLMHNRNFSWWLYCGVVSCVCSLPNSNTSNTSTYKFPRL